MCVKTEAVLKLLALRCFLSAARGVNRSQSRRRQNAPSVASPSLRTRSLAQINRRPHVCWTASAVADASRAVMRAVGRRCNLITASKFSTFCLMLICSARLAMQSVWCEVRNHAKLGLQTGVWTARYGDNMRSCFLHILNGFSLPTTWNFTLQALCCQHYCVQNLQFNQQIWKLFLKAKYFYLLFSFKSIWLRKVRIIFIAALYLHSILSSVSYSSPFAATELNHCGTHIIILFIKIHIAAPIEDG